MFHFNHEPAIPLLTVTRSGFWTMDTVAVYEAELMKLHRSGRPTAFIIDIRSSRAQSREVADALRVMVQRLGPLHAHRTAIVTSAGIAKLQAKRVADPNAQIFTSMVLARDWVTAIVDVTAESESIYNEASIAEAKGAAVHIYGPADVNVTLTPAAALETAKRISDAAVDALIEAVTAPAS